MVEDGHTHALTHPSTPHTHNTHTQLHFEPEFLGRVRLAGSVASLAGVVLYNNYFKKARAVLFPFKQGLRISRFQPVHPPGACLWQRCFFTPRPPPQTQAWPSARAASSALCASRPPKTVRPNTHGTCIACIQRIPCTRPQVPLKRMFFWTMVLGAALGSTQLLLVTGANRALGLSDKLFVLGDSVILTVLGQVRFLLFPFFLGGGRGV